MRLLPLFSLAALLLAGAVVAADDPPAPEAIPVTGEPFRARLTGVDEDWTFEFTRQRQAKRFAADQLVRWGTPAEPDARPISIGGIYAMVLLRGGDRVVGFLQEIKAGMVQLESDVFERVRIPQDRVAAMLLHQLPGDPVRRERRFQQLAGDELEQDQLWLTNGNRVWGSLLSLARLPRASNEEPIRYQIQLETENGKLPIDASEVSAIRFRPSPLRERQPSVRHAVVGFRDGTLLTTDSLQLTGKKLVITPVQATLRAGAAWESEWVHELAYVQPMGGRVEYLSDRQPDAFRHLPFLSLSQPQQNNRSVLGTRLRAGGRLYAKGIGVQSAAVLSYVLDGKYTRFAARLAIDDAAGDDGSVVFQVMVDKEVRYTSPTLRGRDDPLPIDLDISGGRRLTLLVRYADQGDALDYADWLDARLVKEERDKIR